MSSHEHGLASLIYQVVLSLDGAVLGVTLAYAAVRTLLDYRITSKALHQVRSARAFGVSDLLAHLDDKSSETSHQEIENHLVIVRGLVEAKSAIDGACVKRLTRDEGVLVSYDGGRYKAVAIQRTQTRIYNEWRAFFGWTPDILAIFGKSWKKRGSPSLTTVPFILVEGRGWRQSNYVIVDMDGSKQPLPLTMVYDQLQPLPFSPFTFIQEILGLGCPVGVLDEVKILPLGKHISAVGICSLENGIPKIKSCEDLPYFLSEMTKDQMVVDLEYMTNILFWSAIVLGSMSIGFLGYAIFRKWNRRKECGQPTETSSDNVNSLAGSDG